MRMAEPVETTFFEDATHGADAGLTARAKRRRLLNRHVDKILAAEERDARVSDLVRRQRGGGIAQRAHQFALASARSDRAWDDEGEVWVGAECPGVRLSNGGDAP